MFMSPERLLLSSRNRGIVALYQRKWQITPNDGDDDDDDGPYQSKRCCSDLHLANTKNICMNGENGEWGMGNGIDGIDGLNCRGGLLNVTHCSPRCLMCRTNLKSATNWELQVKAGACIHFSSSDKKLSCIVIIAIIT